MHSNFDVKDEERSGPQLVSTTEREQEQEGNMLYMTYRNTFSWCSQPPAMHGSSSTVLETENIASLHCLVIESEPSSPEVCGYFAMMVI